MSAEPTDLDYAVLRRVARGDQAALAELIRRHQGRLYQVAYRLLKDPLEAEDAFQEVFLKVYEHAHRFEPQATVCRLAPPHHRQPLPEPPAPAAPPGIPGPGGRTQPWPIPGPRPLRPWRSRT